MADNLPTPAVSIDEKDKRILYELDLDARQSISQMAKKLRLNKGVVAYRIKRLEESGVIKSYYPMIDYSKLGFFGLRIYTKFTSANSDEEKEIIDFFVKSKHTWWVGTIDGEYSLGAVFWVKRMSDFYGFWNEFKKRYHHLLSQTVVSIYNSVYDLNYTFLVPDGKRTYSHVGLSPQVGVSRTELATLNALSEDARAPITAISRKAGLSPVTIQRAIRTLKRKGIVRGFRPLLDLNKLGVVYYKLNVYVKDYGQLDKMVKYALHHPNAIYVNEAIGYADFEMEVLTRSHEEFRQIFGDFKAKFQETIRDADYFVYSRIHKIV